MTSGIAKTTFVLLAVCWYLIRLQFARRARHAPIIHSARGLLERTLLTISLIGLGIIPLFYIASGQPRFADYASHPLNALLGILLTIVALLMFYLTHRALGRNWSVSLDVRENHKLITEGIYRFIRHPMYTAFWLWAGAQALLLPNWVAGLSGLIGFGILFFGRVAREERMMMDNFGVQYRNYMSKTRRIVPGIY